MIRRAWKPLAVASVFGASGYFYYYSRKNWGPQTFNIPVRTKGEDGKAVMTNKTFTKRSMKDVEAQIHERATSEVHARPNGITWKHTTASLPSNDPTEDASSQAIIQRDASDPSAPGDLLFFAVMDGHGGPHTSQLLSRVLINAVTLELSNLIKDSEPNNFKPGVLRTSHRWWATPVESIHKGADSEPHRVSLAIQDAFEKLDHELINAPLQVLANSLDQESRKNKVIPDLSQHPLALKTMQPAISGSCALLAMFDTAHEDLYIACTGDCRAVAGIWKPTADGKGTWCVEVLSEDQTGRNPSEITRVLSEHPTDEAANVIRAGRILGGLEPSRAFGDARYKWSRAIQETLNQIFMVGNNQPLRPPPSPFKTPPYVIARPVVTHRKLSLPSGSYDQGVHPALRFLVLATDGLWDQLSSEDVVKLVGGHFAGLKGSVSKNDLNSIIPTSAGSPTVEGKSKKRVENGTWAFVDNNVSAHLIRNAFGGGDTSRLRELLSIPAPYSRRYRDDVIVTVVWWEDGREESVKVAR